MTDHISLKHRIENMRKSEIRALLDDVVLSEDERSIMELIYIEKKPLGYVADVMGYSESGIKKIHCRIIKRINNLR